MTTDSLAVDALALGTLAEDVQEAGEATASYLAELAEGRARPGDLPQRLADLALGLVLVALRCAAAVGSGCGLERLGPVLSAARGSGGVLSAEQRRRLVELAARCRREGRLPLSSALVDSLRLVDLAASLHSSGFGQLSAVDVVRGAVVDESADADAICALLGLLESAGGPGGVDVSSLLASPADATAPRAQEILPR